MKVLCVEDDRELRESLRRGLTDAGFRVEVAGSYAEGALAAVAGGVDVLVFDVLLPGGSGVDLCRHLRANGHHTPVLFLTALGAEVERLEGFESGGDDYLVKPFSLQELIARIRALGRRPPALLPELRRIADLEVDLEARSVARAGRPVTLTAQEWALLEFFVRHEGQLVSRAQITAYVWDDNHDPFSNLLEVLIWRLRRKIDQGFEPVLIHTIRGAGYRFGT